jgi:hypothetical protein
LHQVNGASDVRVDDVPYILEILIQKSASEPMPSIGQEGINGPAGRGGPELVHPLHARQIGFDDRGLRPQLSESLACRMNLGAVCCHQEVESLSRADRREF